jgi:hypothetical protein
MLSLPAASEPPNDPDKLTGLTMSDEWPIDDASFAAVLRGTGSDRYAHLYRYGGEGRARRSVGA